MLLEGLHHLLAEPLLCLAARIQILVVEASQLVHPLRLRRIRHIHYRGDGEWCPLSLIPLHTAVVVQQHALSHEEFAQFGLLQPFLLGDELPPTDDRLLLALECGSELVLLLAQGRVEGVLGLVAVRMVVVAANGSLLNYFYAPRQ